MVREPAGARDLCQVINAKQNKIFLEYRYFKRLDAISYIDIRTSIYVCSLITIFFRSELNSIKNGCLSKPARIVIVEH